MRSWSATPRSLMSAVVMQELRAGACDLGDHGAQLPDTCEFGGPCRDRTYDQLIKSQLLYQLS